ncbi:uncharacterized protein JCM6883_006232 [Sporobolomyces salmoneus]|uniref:uncharacterized protein n=1 Tax=Sporobolomyces salmoneus TaxID=183962 RepID=UPI0031757970
MSGLRTMQVLRIVNNSTASLPLTVQAAVPWTAVCTPHRSARSFSHARVSRESDISSSYPSRSTASSPSPSYRTSSPSQHLYTSPPSEQKSFLENLLSRVSPLPNADLIDPLLAERCLTHKSGVEKSQNRGRPGMNSGEETQTGGKNGHNEKMSFVGRRILRLYLTLYLNSKLSSSHPSLLAHAVSPRAIDALLNTKQLGATVGAAWKLEEAMRWREVRGPTGEMTGLWKVRGMGVEAVLGGVFTSQGIETASKVFHELVLPNLTFPQTLRKALDGAAQPVESLQFSGQPLQAEVNA